MTTIARTLGRPRVAASRGGDCRAYDLTQDRSVRGPHVFATPGDCQISNGLLRLTSSAGGTTPALTVEAWRGRVVVGDTYVDTYGDTYTGSISDPEWFSMGTLTIDSPTVPPFLSAVRLWRVNPEAITIRLVAPLMADAFVTLPRGWRSVRIQHGSSRPPTLSGIQRRIQWTASPSPVGVASLGRVAEASAGVDRDGMLRWVGALDPVTASAGSFSLTAPAGAVARFGAGVGYLASQDTPAHQHQQLGDASRPRMVLT